MKKKKIQKIAIVTYNRIGEGQYQNGFIKRKDKVIYIAQNDHKAEWAAGSVSEEEKKVNRARAAKSVTRNITTLRDMDHIYLYVGADGGEEAIIQTKDIPATKITYVMCDCNYSTKMDMIESIGNASAEIIDCECGGRSTLEKILLKLLK